MVDTINDYFNGAVSAVEDNEPSLKLSYSGMNVFCNCNYRYNKTYNEGKRAFETSLPLELGSICHKVLECKGLAIQNKEPVDYEYLYNILFNGFDEITEKTRETLLGVDALKKKYFEDWYTVDKDSGLDYDHKVEIFKKVLEKEMNSNDEWKPLYFELPFQFVYKNRVIFNGFIDRVDINKEGDYRVVDYKTSKKIYDRSKLTTSLQFGIYALAIYQMFGKLPVEYIYRFVLLDKEQEAMSKGFEKRLEKKLDTILTKMDKNSEMKEWKPNPSPLCHWCSFSITNPNAKEFKYECPYYSLWTPTNKTFDVHKAYNPKEDFNNAKRKLVF